MAWGWGCTCLTRVLDVCASLVAEETLQRQLRVGFGRFLSKSQLVKIIEVFLCFTRINAFNRNSCCSTPTGLLIHTSKTAPCIFAFASSLLQPFSQADVFPCRLHRLLKVGLRWDWEEPVQTFSWLLCLTAAWRKVNFC